MTTSTDLGLTPKHTKIMLDLFYTRELPVENICKVYRELQHLDALGITDGSVQLTPYGYALAYGIFVDEGPNSWSSKRFAELESKHRRMLKYCKLLRNHS